MPHRRHTTTLMPGLKPKRPTYFYHQSGETIWLVSRLVYRTILRGRRPEFFFLSKETGAGRARTPTSHMRKAVSRETNAQW